tara:strand:+ start:113 stop:958 length:846 start_codon:yes stop_codon:yes gene_type:complete
MGLFKSFKKMLAPIGGVVGFALGGPAGAALGSGIGSLAGGGDIEDALFAGAMGFAGGSLAKGANFGLGTGKGIGSLLPSYKGKAMLGFGAAPTQTLAKTGGFDPSKMIGVGASEKGKGIFSMFDDMSTGTKLGLGAGALALAGGLFDEEEEEGGTRRPEGPPGEAFGTVVGPLTGKVYDIPNKAEMDEYNEELRRLQDPDFRYPVRPPVNPPITLAHGGDVHAGGGEVDGPGTGTSDSVPARLSDGEFVLTAKAVRGAGGGDRDLGAARLYDMMSELEATG